MSYNIKTKPLLKGVLLLFVLWLFFAGVYYSRPFLVPLAFASILAMLLWPITRKMESWGINSKLAALVSVLLLVGVAAGVFFLLGKQVKSFSEDLPQMKQQFEQRLSAAQDFLKEEFGITEQRQEKVLQESKQNAGNVGQQFAASFLSAIAKTLLMLVYIFLLLIYRQRFKNFILKYSPEEQREKVHGVILTSAHVAKSYLSGRLLLMFILAIAYCTGLSFIGIPNAIFFGVLAAILGIIPFVGNVLGAFFPLAMALLNQGSSAAIGVIILFTAVQLLENYVLEPLVVGKKVDLNGFFAISVVVLGEIIWGLSGAILAMPLLGIAKIIFDNIRQLQPMGYLIGEDQNEGDSDFSDKIVRKVKGAVGKN